jgi:solute carrier family 30 (zinc transporter), member 1
LVLIVGCLGLASNILGLFLFHDHGHSHGGGEGHSHSKDQVKNAEEGNGHVHSHSNASHIDAQTRAIGDESGNIADVLPQAIIAGYKKSGENIAIAERLPTTPTRKSIPSSGEIHARHRRRTSGSFGRGFGSVDNIHVHPASFRNDIIKAARLEEHSESETEGEALLDEEGDSSVPKERSRIISHVNGSPQQQPQARVSGYGSINKRKSLDYPHNTHGHSRPKDPDSGHSHGHSHGDLNMRGVFLHVMGDAMGNIGVIVSALVIWLTHSPERFYVDPAVSLLITVIILHSAIPLCKAASRILLQAVPVGLSIDEITSDIEQLPRVIEAHHLHVWQLSDTKLVCSLHVKVDCEIEGTGSASYMHLAKEIRKCLHGYGIHSSTIQPEFCSPNDPPSGSTNVTGDSPTRTGTKNTQGDSLRPEGPACLLDCGDNCLSNNQCCPIDTKGSSK